LPGVAAFHPGVEARLMSNFLDQANQLNLVLSQDYPVGIRIGAVPFLDASWEVDGAKRKLSIHGDVDDLAMLDPNQYLFHRNGNGTDIILPAALYRQQVTNANFPRVSGDVTQVSPLLEKLALRYFQGFDYGYDVVDGLIGRSPRPEMIPGEERESHGIFLFDTQPVINGATYRYYLVRFKANHEVDQIIPAGNVTLP
jgi:hypothetical protein